MTINRPTVVFTFLIFILLTACFEKRLEEKGFSVNSSPEKGKADEIDGISRDSLILETRPGRVLLTGIPRYRLTSIYKVNHNESKKTSFIGTDHFYNTYSDLGTSPGNQWNYNFMPGFSAVYGYNLVNVSHYDTKSQTIKEFFEEPVLIKTLYYPAFSSDTLNYKPVNRNYFMISAYDDDTNGDGFLNVKDLRRFYYFDINAEGREPLVPVNYSVMKSQYDPANDFMYVFARMDENANGQADEHEDIHVFWIHLNNPEATGRQY